MKKICWTIWFGILLGGMVWPGIILGDRVEPFVLGFPFLFFWFIAIILLQLISLLLLYRSEYKGRK
jgi:hypothetical protein